MPSKNGYNLNLLHSNSKDLDYEDHIQVYKNRFMNRLILTPLIMQVIICDEGSDY